MTSVYLSLGSNMGNREDYLNRAVEALGQLPDTKLLKASSFYETPAWGKTDQADFLNMACQVETQLGPIAFLDHCQEIERNLDRVRHEHWGPRTVDIDILLYGEEVWSSDRLCIPHPYMHERAFVLVPLLEVEADLREPQTGKSYRDYLKLLDTSDIHVLT